MILKVSFLLLCVFSCSAFAQLGGLTDALPADVPVADLPVDDLPVDDLPVDDLPVDDLPADPSSLSDTADVAGDLPATGAVDDLTGASDSDSAGGGGPLSAVNVDGVQEALDSTPVKGGGAEKDDGTLKETLNPVLAESDPTSKRLDKLTAPLEEVPLKDSLSGATQELVKSDLGAAVQRTLQDAELYKVTDQVQGLTAVNKLIGTEEGLLKGHILEVPTTTEKPTEGPVVCKEVCGQNETYTCGSLCGDTCASYFFPPRDQSICDTSKKCVRGCYCKPGYNRDPVTKQCVYHIECPKPFYEHVYFYCDQPLQELQVCGNPCKETLLALQEKIQCDPFHCVTTCYCRKGYFRDVDGNCVSMKLINTFTSDTKGYLVDDAINEISKNYKPNYGPRKRIDNVVGRLIAVNHPKVQNAKKCRLI